MWIRHELTRNAAAEYPRAVHEPQSPGSAGVPPACGSTSAFLPSPTVSRSWGRHGTSWRPQPESTAARLLAYVRTYVWPLLLDQILRSCVPCCASLPCGACRGCPIWPTETILPSPGVTSRPPRAKFLYWDAPLLR